MKLRQLTIGIETTTGVAFDALKRARGGIVVFKDSNGFVICDVEVEQIQVNVIRRPKPKGRVDYSVEASKKR